MDYRNAAGRNWSAPRRKRRPAKLASGTGRGRLPETLPPPGRLEHRDAPGRNWARERPNRPRVSLARPDTAAGYPARERGGGDHNCPYEFHAPSAVWPFPFALIEYARLLRLRGRMRDGELADDLYAPAELDPVGAD